ncbi:MAG: hypothetical protein HYZ72_06170 [Deltaproteobacteria bacterium]|nr:hypothetical protein [Deltaproteobacteria bacterium]
MWRPIQHSPGTAALVDALERHVSAEAAAIMRAPFALGDAEELRALVAGAGFRDVTIRIAVRMVRFPSPEEFVRRLVAAVPLAGLADAVARVDVDARAALIGDVSAALRSYVDDEGLAVPMESHVVVAQT